MSLVTFWFLFQLHSCFQRQDMVDQYLPLTKHVPTITLWECSSSCGLSGKVLTHKLGVASSNPILGVTIANAWLPYRNIKLWPQVFLKPHKLLLFFLVCNCLWGIPCLIYLCTITGFFFGIWLHLCTSLIPIPRAAAGCSIESITS